MRLKRKWSNTWRGIIKQRTPFETLINEAMASLMCRGIEPTKRQVCEEIGLDYDKVDDRCRVTLAIAKHKKYFDLAWRDAFIPLGQFDEAYQKASDDVHGYNEWKRKDISFVETWYAHGWSEEDLHELWIHSEIWEEFLRIANKWNLHLFVAEGIPFRSDGFRYKQPRFWELIVKQIDIGRRLQKGVLTILERHQDLGMILTSGEPIEETIQVAQDSLKMIADGAPLRYRCEPCEEQGNLVAFRTQKELVDHYRKVHNI
jgi:hypothetical protein